MVMESGLPSSRRVDINVGGTSFSTTEDTLRRFPKSLLAQLAGVDDGDTDVLQSFNASGHIDLFLDRSPRCFPAILEYHRTGRLEIPLGVRWEELKRELDYYQLPAVGEYLPGAARCAMDTMEVVQRVVEAVVGCAERFSKMGRTLLHGILAHGPGAPGVAQPELCFTALVPNVKGDYDMDRNYADDDDRQHGKTFMMLADFERVKSLQRGLDRGTKAMISSALVSEGFRVRWERTVVHLHSHQLHSQSSYEANVLVVTWHVPTLSEALLLDCTAAPQAAAAAAHRGPASLPASPKAAPADAGALVVASGSSTRSGSSSSSCSSTSGHPPTVASPADSAAAAAATAEGSAECHDSKSAPEEAAAPPEAGEARQRRRSAPAVTGSGSGCGIPRWMCLSHRDADVQD